MARPTTAKHHTQCSHCDAEMPPVKHKRPFAKMCHDCRGELVGTKGKLYVRMTLGYESCPQPQHNGERNA